MSKKRKASISIKYRILMGLWMVQLPFLGLFLYTSSVTRTQMNRQLAQSQTGLMTVYVNSLQKQLDHAAEFLFVNCWGSNAFAEGNAQETRDEAVERLTPILGKAAELLDNNPEVTAVAVRNRQLTVNRLFLHTDKKESRSYRARMQRIVNTVLNDEDNSANLGWKLYRQANRCYLARTARRLDSSAVVLIDLSELAESARTHYGIVASVALRNDAEILTEAFWSQDYDDSMITERAKDGSYYFIKNRNHTYLVTEARFATLRLVCAADYQYRWDWLYLEVVLLLLSVLGSIGVAAFYLQRTFGRPLDDLVQVMTHVRSGQTKTRAQRSGNLEFDHISDTFNEMLDTLDALKVEAYESQLRAKQSQMDALRLQIRRHFFLNCLKNIYALASSGKTEEVKKSALLLSTHLRYTLNFRSNATDLETEAEMCRVYMELQGIGQDIGPELIVKIEPGLEDFPVPPVSLLTVLENSCKYGTRQDRGLKVTITAQRRQLDAQRYVFLAVQDNGEGFPPELLQKLNSEIEQVRDDGHVGLVNTLQRMQMLYGAECQILFSNRGGARVDCIIPEPPATGQTNAEEGERPGE